MHILQKCHFPSTHTCPASQRVSSSLSLGEKPGAAESGCHAPSVLILPTGHFQQERPEQEGQSDSHGEDQLGSKTAPQVKEEVSTGWWRAQKVGPSFQGKLQSAMDLETASIPLLVSAPSRPTLLKELCA